MTEYLQQAEKFLKDTATTLEVKESEKQSTPHWEGEGLNANRHIQYTCTLKNNHHSYTFDFWGSVNDWEKIDAFRNIERFSLNKTQADYKREDILKKNNLFIDWRKMIKKEDIEKYIKEKLSPTEYDILACLSLVWEEDFEDWCASYGYDTDSRKAYKIYQACLEQDHNLRRLFTHKELEKLADIQ